MVHLYHQAFTALRLPVTIRLNNRKVLAGIAEVSGVGDRLVDFTVALDKLDKIGREGVVAELETKGFTAEEIRHLEPSMQSFGSSSDSLAFLRSWLAPSAVGMQGVEELEFVLSHVGEVSTVVDITLARGLNYYTGCIMEVTANEVAMGSVGGGGRYDDLTGIFGLRDVSGVGISFGLDRIILCLEELKRLPTATTAGPRALMFHLSAEDGGAAYKLTAQLRKQGLRIEFYPEPAKVKKQFDYALKREIPYVLFYGGAEQAEGLVHIKNITTGDQESIPVDQVAARIATL